MPDANQLNTVVYFYGGGLGKWDKSDFIYAEIGKTFVQNRFGFVCVHYRLYFQHVRYPDYLTDCSRFIAFVGQLFPAYGGFGEMFVYGQSAGAWIAAMLCVNREYLNGVGISLTEIR